jgi:hypothetical protein
MKVKTLIEALQKVPEDHDVIVRASIGWLGKETASFSISAQNPEDALEIGVYSVESATNGFYRSISGKPLEFVPNR